MPASLWKAELAGVCATCCRKYVLVLAVGGNARSSALGRNGPWTSAAHNLAPMRGGSSKWTFPTGLYVDSSPAISGDGLTVFVGLEDMA